MAFFVLVLTPVLLSLSILAVDVSGWHALREQAQREADTISLQAAQLLPNVESATLYINRVLQANPVFQNGFSFSTPQGNSIVSVTLRAQYPSVFGRFLSAAGNSAAAELLRVERTATAQIAPLDTIIILSDGATLRPALGSAPWELPEWSDQRYEPSRFWECSRIAAPVRIWRGEQQIPVSSDPEGWATQACFNPVWSTLKLAAVKAVDFFGAHRSNRLGLIFTPGSISHVKYAVARRLVGTPGDHIPGGFVDTHVVGAEASWQPYRGGESGVGDEACVLQSNFDLRYELPQSSSGFGIEHTAQNQSCGSPLRSALCSAASSFESALSTCYFSDNLKLREAIYWRAAKLATAEGFDGIPNIPRALLAGIEEFQLTGQSSEHSARGNLAYRTHRTILVLTDYLPEPFDPALGQALEAARRQRINLSFVLLRHPHEHPATESRSELFEQRAGFLADSTAEQVRFYVAENDAALHQQVLPQLFLRGRRYALRT